MEQSLKEVLNNQHPSQELSLKQILESFSHIELTEDELDLAIIDAKRKKEALLKHREMNRRAEENRRYLTGLIWSKSQTEEYMKWRANNIFGGKFNFDGQASKYFRLLVGYFSMDFSFFELAKELGVDHPTFTKGLYLGGNFGVGKTWLMKLFQRNNRQVFTIQNAKAIADIFEAEGEPALAKFVESPSLPENDAENFFQKRMGLCIDDLGTEQVKNHFGNKKNVIGDLIELRYASENTGPLLHVTTNLTGDQLKEFYGLRVASRLRETMNIIDFVGEDLRK
jgi:DNA replication protein DnaC